MAVGVGEVIFHQHREEGFGPNVCDHPVKGMTVLLVEANALAIDIFLNEDLLCGLGVGSGEADVLVHVVSIESV